MLELKYLILLMGLVGYISAKSSEELLIPGIPFDCSNKPTGFYKDTNYCDIFHVCVSFQQRKTYGCPQVGAQFFYDENLKMCEFTARNPKGCPNNKYYQEIQPNQYITSAPQVLTTEKREPWKEFVQKTDQFTCLNKKDGFYPSRWCNVFYRCANGVRFEFLCAKQRNGQRLWWIEHSESESKGLENAQCSFPCEINRACTSPGGLLIEAENGTVISESSSEVERIMQSCQKPEVVKPAINHETDIFRLPSADRVNNSCADKPDGIFQGDSKYCNVFHVCYGGTKRDFICAKAIHSDYELWWDESRNRCDWPCKVKCNKQIFGGRKSASEIKRIDGMINSADCQIDTKSYKYAFLNRF